MTTIYKNQKVFAKDQKLFKSHVKNIIYEVHKNLSQIDEFG